MVTGFIKYKKGAASIKNGSMPLILTLSILTFIVSFTLITRWLINTYQEVNIIPTFSPYTNIADVKEPNRSKQEILSLISSYSRLSENNNKVNSIELILYKSLHEYLNSSEVFLTSKQALQIESYLFDLQEIMHYEGETEFA